MLEQFLSRPADDTATGPRPKPILRLALLTIAFGIVEGALGNTTIPVLRGISAVLFGVPFMVGVTVWALRARHNRRLRTAAGGTARWAGTAGTGTGESAAAPPAPQPFGVSHQGAEALAAAWMQWMGLAGATATQFGGDGGIDVTQREWVAQVKNYTRTNVGRPEVQNLYGVAAAERKRPMFFTSSGYSSGAVEFADKVGVALFVYDAVGGALTPVNLAAKIVMKGGHGQPPAARQ
ncbi:restriction endonuclease [Curtobacterium sp. MCBD17_040]|uniref:restriction endonuclease n=1 Tax=Curtobacterium sp. MCBD17_040 TaxID=2175674 RepID=UPI000DA8E9A7|nr:restriction endonuclease [Curtobacterium sp. MCBD17_040]WIB65851.1 restriction endonuclease [Curtobacterium sp. MCBD17_040]